MAPVARVFVVAVMAAGWARRREGVLVRRRFRHLQRAGDRKLYIRLLSVLLHAIPLCPPSSRTALHTAKHTLESQGFKQLPDVTRLPLRGFPCLPRHAAAFSRFDRFQMQASCPPFPRAQGEPRTD